MANLHALDIVSGVCALIYSIFGVRILMYMDADWSVKVNMHLFATGIFVLALNVAAALVCLFHEWRVATYFGYLVTYTGKSLHFMLMGFFCYLHMCPGSRGIGRCLGDKQKSAFDKILVITSLAGVVVGIILLILRCAGQTPAHKYGIELGQSVQLDAVNIAALVASCGMIFYGCFWFDKTVTGDFKDPMMNLGYGANLIFILAAGTFSAWSSVKLSPTVGMLLGFLYNPIGRGSFYICMGFYLFAVGQWSGDVGSTISWICGIVAIVVGVIYLVLRFFAQSHPAARDQQVQLGVR